MMNGEYLPATQGAQQELVLLHGWGSTRDIWRPLLATLRPWANITLLDLPGCAPGLASDENAGLTGLLEAILAAAPDRAVYLGWSLGGQLAQELAARYTQRVAALVTVCSNPRFQAAADWPGMEAEIFASFQTACEADPASALRRFRSLQVQGAAQPRVLLRQLQDRRQAGAGRELLQGLRWLEQFDHRSTLSSLAQAQLHLLAERDALVPANLEPALLALLGATPAAQVRLIAGASHLAPLERATELGGEIYRFLEATGLLRETNRHDPGPDKKDIASSFSRAAPAYDSVAQLQRDVGSRLLSHLERGSLAPSVLLDLGCGTGSCRPELRARCPDASYIGLDLAPGMVQFARAQADDDSVWLVADAESLPLAAGSVELVFSSLAIQWCQRPELFFAELARVLRPGGRCVFSTLGPGTLHELRQAWAAVDSRQHVNTFLPENALMAAAEATPGVQLTLETEAYCMRYARVGELLTELKTLGAHNMNRDRPIGLTSRKSLQGMLQAYERWRDQGQLPATYDVIFGEVTKL